MKATLILLLPLSAFAQTTLIGGTPVMFSVDDNKVQDGNIVNIEVFGEALCPDTTRFLRNQLAKTWQHYGSSGRLNVTYHPFGVFGKTACTPKGDDDFECRCQHGHSECVLNALQSCVMFALPKPEDHIETVVCIQGKRQLKTAIEQCVEDSDKRLNLDAKFLEECATSPLGRRLMSGHGDRQSRVASGLYWVPWVMIEGERSKRSERHLWDELCSGFLKPQPEECNTKI